MPALTRREYRQEYLKSDEWKALRAKVMTPGVKCIKCGKKATDTHHLRYRKIYNVIPSDLVPLCRPCHELVERAKKAKVIPSEHEIADVLRVTERQLERRSARKSSKVILSEAMLRSVNKLTLNKQRFVCGIMKLPHPGDFTEWAGIITTQGNIDHIQWAIKHYSPRLKKRRKKGTIRRGVKIHY